MRPVPLGQGYQHPMTIINVFQECKVTCAFSIHGHLGFGLSFQLTPDPATPTDEDDRAVTIECKDMQNAKW